MQELMKNNVKNILLLLMWEQLEENLTLFFINNLYLILNITYN